MASKYWIKMWHEVVDDPKMGRLPNNLWRRFFEICLLAGELQFPDDDIQNGRLPPIGDISWRLRIDEETLRQEFDAMARLGMLEYRADTPLDGYWYITHFNERQRKMTKAEYMRRLRNKPINTGVSYQPVTDGVTDPLPSVTQNKNKNKNKNKSAAIAFPPSLNTPEFLDVWDSWEKHRREIRKPLKPTTRAAQLKKAAQYLPAQAIWVINKSIENGWTGLFWDKLANGNGAVAKANATAVVGEF